MEKSGVDARRLTYSFQVPPEKEDDYHYPYRDLPCPDIVLEIPGISDGR